MSRLLSNITADSLFKYTGARGEAVNGGNGKWFLPHGSRPGKWMPPISGKLEPCANGYHLCRLTDLLQWNGPALWVAEARGERVDDDDKIVVREARLVARVKTWNERTMRLFACDCAERALGMFEAQYPDDMRPRRAIETARRHANGEATVEELAAARDASGDAWDAAAAAWAAARDASGDARDAARAAERTWQSARLLAYLRGDVGAA
jgi:hypothetical protein